MNKAIRDLVIAERGEQQWDTIASAAGSDPDFIGMQTYDDAVTYALVGKASEILEVPAAELLRLFGRYWIRYTADEGYGSLLQLFGATMEEFLDNLGNDLHARVALTMPELRPPEFRTERLAADRWQVHYLSERPGLAPMVLGLLEGLAQRFDREVEVQHLETVADSKHHELYEVRIVV
ncbi:MAG: heme NO-binding domain-containing protein [Pseudomonadota bacterium]